MGGEWMSVDSDKQQPMPGAWRLLAIWAGIGLQSFGGGASTTLLIQRTFIERYGWLSYEEFNRLWNLCLLTPGINLIAVTVLIGKKLGGTRGIILSVAGLLLPSASITCLLAALFLRIEHAAVVQAALRGIVPATAGIMALVLVNFARPLVQARTAVGWWFVWVSAALAAVFAFAILAWNISAIAIVLCAAVVGMFFFAPRASRTNHAIPDAQTRGQQ
jgi:chromate transporter